LRGKTSSRRAKLALGVALLLVPVAVFLSLLTTSLHYAAAAITTLTLVMCSHIALEWRLPQHDTKTMSAVDHARTLWHGFIYGLGVGAVAVFAARLASLRLRSAGGFGEFHLFSNPRFAAPATVLSVLIFGDLLDYVRHRLEHASNGLFWRLHAVHHSITELTSMRGARVHPMEPLLVYGCYGIVGGCIGASLRETFVAVVLAVLVMTTQHINVDCEIGWIRYLIVTAETHRWHHHRDRVPACNLANVFTVWDLLFGSHHQPHAFDASVGLEPIRDRFPSAIAAQAVLPFQPVRWRALERAGDAGRSQRA
jgi:sterol desaturase/sphingolipid hydroxylase (fatty acid hydroxylase superfamily)